MTGSAKNRLLNSALGMATRLLPALGSCYAAAAAAEVRRFRR